MLPRKGQFNVQALVKLENLGGETEHFTQKCG